VPPVSATLVIAAVATPLTVIPDTLLLLLMLPLLLVYYYRLFAALDSDCSGVVTPSELTTFLASHVAEWHKAEADIARAITRAMGSDAPSKRAWLSKLRSRFFR
jgi:hypothetical protein